MLAGSTGWLGTGSQWRFGGSVGVDFGQNVIDVYASPDYEEIVGGEEGDDRTFTYRFFADHSFGSDLIAAAFTFADTDHEELLEPGDAARRRGGCDRQRRDLDDSGGRLPSASE